METTATAPSDGLADVAFVSTHTRQRERSESGYVHSKASNLRSSRDSSSETLPLLGQSIAIPDDHESEHGDDDTHYTEFKSLPWWKRPSIYWLLPTFLLTAVAYGGILSPKLNLILTLICRDQYAEQAVLSGPLAAPNERCRDSSIQALVAQFTLYGSLIAGILSAIASPKMGALSDRYGRKKMMALATVGIMISEVITILAARNSDSISVNWILAGYAFEGMFGSFTCSMALASSYAADCTPPHERNVAFGYMQGCLFSGLALGPLLAAKTIEATGSVISIFYVALGAHLGFVVFLVLFIPESLSKTRQLAARERHRNERLRAGPSSDWIARLRAWNFLEPLKILYPTGETVNVAARRNLVLLACIDTLIFGVIMTATTIIVIYTYHEFGWEAPRSSRFLSTLSIFRVCWLFVVLPLVTRFIRGPKSKRKRSASGADMFDLSTIRLGILFDTLGYVGYTTSRTGLLFTVSGIVASVGSIGSPSLQAALTKHIHRSRTGQLMGAMGLLHALARIVGPLVFNYLYKKTVGKFTQAVFVCLAATFAVAFLVSWFVKPHVRLDEPSPRLGPISDTTEADA